MTVVKRASSFFIFYFLFHCHCTVEHFGFQQNIIPSVWLINWCTTYIVYVGYGINLIPKMPTENEWQRVSERENQCVSDIVRERVKFVCVSSIFLKDIRAMLIKLVLIWSLIQWNVLLRLVGCTVQIILGFLVLVKWMPFCWFNSDENQLTSV